MNGDNYTLCLGVDEVLQDLPKLWQYVQCTQISWNIEPGHQGHWSILGSTFLILLNGLLTLLVFYQVDTSN